MQSDADPLYDLTMNDWKRIANRNHAVYGSLTTRSTNRQGLGARLRRAKRQVNRRAHRKDDMQAINAGLNDHEVQGEE